MSTLLLPPMARWAASLLWSTQLCHFMGVIACKKSGGRKLNLSGRKLLLKYASSSPPTSQVVFNGNILTGASCYHRCQDRVRGPVSEQESQTVIGVRTMWLIGTILFQRLTRVFSPCVVGNASANSFDLPKFFRVLHLRFRRRIPIYFPSVSGL